MQDGIFAAFCKRLKYDNIRIYEQQQGSMQQEAAQRRLEFTTQKTKLENQLQFEVSRINSVNERIRTLEESAESSRRILAEEEQKRKAIKDDVDEVLGAIDLLKEEMATKQGELDEHAEKMNTIKKEVGKRARDVEEASKTITQLEGEIERNAAGRYAVLRRCKLEEIELPLTEDSESLDKLPIEDTLHQPEADPDAMDIDEENEPVSTAINRVAGQDYGIEVDFSELPEELQENNDEKVEEELLEKIKLISSELEKMAPNMKAVERLEGVESRLHDTDKEFEKSRRDAKAARERFQAVKEKRLVISFLNYSNITNCHSQFRALQSRFHSHFRANSRRL